MTQTAKQFFATGKRKTAIARVILRSGSGQMIINRLSVDDFFSRQDHRALMKKAFHVTHLEQKFDVHVNVFGGGITGQAEAIVLGCARALVKYDEHDLVVAQPESADHEVDQPAPEGALGLRRILRKHGMLTRDARKVQRKLYGRRKARKLEQYRKR